MQDKAIAAIGKWQLETELKGLEPVDLYIENMFPNKDYQMLLLVFEICDNGDTKKCCYKGIDIEKVSAEKNDFRKYAYRNGTSARAGDVTFTTRLAVKKLENLKQLQFRKFTKNKNFISESTIFELIEQQYLADFKSIESEVITYLKNSPKDLSHGISFKITIDDTVKYLIDFELITNFIVQEFTKSKNESNNTISKAKNKRSSLTDKVSDNIYGFAAPFAFSTPDKEGAISGFFNKSKNWRNYPLNEEDALNLEIGSSYIENNLKGYFYGYEYLVVPNPILTTDFDRLRKTVINLQTAFIEQKGLKNSKKRAEEYIMRKIAEEENFLSVDVLFFKTSNSAMKLQLHLEEQLPSRFRQVFITTPEKVNQNKLFKNIFGNKDENDLMFNFQIIKDFFSPQPKNKSDKFNSPYFLKVVNDIFRGNKISTTFVLEKIMNYIRLSYNENLDAEKRYDNALEVPVLKAIMLISYLQELNIITHNKNYKYMEPEIPVKEKETTFMTDVFNDFVKTNSNFLDSDIKVGIFSVGVLTRFLFDIQSGSLSNTPFEKKLRGYKLNAELLLNVYTEALNKIQQYQNFYVYTDLREIINTHFVLKSNELKKMSNNEVSFYFVAGLEMGKKFKRPKQESENK